MKLNFKRISFITTLAILSSCSSINSLTRAKTLKSGDHELYVGATYSNLNVKASAEGDAPEVLGFDFGARYGLTDSDELGFRLANSGSYAAVDYKRALVSGGALNLSLGALVGFLKYTIGTAPDDISTTLLDFGVPLYVDYEVSEDFALIFSPKYLFSRLSVTGADAAATSSSLILSGGLRYGQEAGVHLEFGYQLPFEDGADGAWQASGGFFF